MATDKTILPNYASKQLYCLKARSINVEEATRIGLMRAQAKQNSRIIRNGRFQEPESQLYIPFGKK